MQNVKTKVCPKCNGKGFVTVEKIICIGGDIEITERMNVTCDVCKGKGVVAEVLSDIYEPREEPIAHIFTNPSVTLEIEVNEDKQVIARAHVVEYESSMRLNTDFVSGHTYQREWVFKVIARYEDKHGTRCIPRWVIEIIPEADPRIDKVIRDEMREWLKRNKKGAVE